ncbi:MAG: hypothetical protein ACEQSB_06475 [Undibacterium sp.]
MTFSNPNTRIDLVNIALILVAAGAALVMPFPLFLFAYAVLGPLHYLTEISWLHDRSYFIPEKKSIPIFLSLGLIATLLLLTNKMPYWFLSAAVYALFGWAFILTSVKTATRRDVSIAVLFVTTILFIIFEPPVYMLLFAIFIPTLVHVFAFTAAFMLSGALKSRSGWGMASFLLLIAVALGLLAYVPKAPHQLSSYVLESYQPFVFVNETVMSLLFGEGETRLTVESAAASKAGIAVMQFIAFAYTYHYLNWFSKVRVIGWNSISARRRGGLLLVWLAALGSYAYDYRVGVQALFLLSFLHVLFEFPLNHRSFSDIGKNLALLMRPVFSRSA